jgi:KDO2-lipid IV(A) lauroyltransferase
LLGGLAYRLSARNRRLCAVQLAMALPGLPAAEHRRIARQCMENQGMTALETVALPRLRREGAPWLRLEGAERFAAAHARGRGVVLVTAHAANWELLPIALERLQIRALAVASTLTNPRLNRIISEIRRFDYMDVAERGSDASPRQLLSCLKRGDALVLVNDVDIEAQGVFVDFFGIPANTPRAPASLALKLEAPLLTYFDTRQPDGSHVIAFSEVPITAAIRNDADPIRALTQAITARAEAHIRAHPEQWMWNHRRWKRRPPGEHPPTDGGS